ncbi:U4/U6 small nuclear ribonucleoprotein SNU13 [Pancytospora epiphaga]|nr:U4/U6 small nuclear ribonucleoprotein SNU13 [Pancytospora epiphaga]
MEKEQLTEAKMQELYKLLYNLKASDNVKVGYNAAAKSVNKGTALLVVVARDTEPYAIVEALPIICDQKGVEIVHVSSKTALGKACHLQVNVIACAIFADRNEDSSRLQSQITQILK